MASGVNATLLLNLSSVAAIAIPRLRLGMTNLMDGGEVVGSRFCKEERWSGKNS